VTRAHAPRQVAARIGELQGLSSVEAASGYLAELRASLAKDAQVAAALVDLVGAGYAKPDDARAAAVARRVAATRKEAEALAAQLAGVPGGAAEEEQGVEEDGAAAGGGLDDLSAEEMAALEEEMAALRPMRCALPSVPPSKHSRDEAQ
jgi:hypothetical protein